VRFVVPQTAYASQIQVHKLLVSCPWRRRYTFFTTVSRHALNFKCEVFLYHVSWYFFVTHILWLSCGANNAY